MNVGAHILRTPSSMAQVWHRVKSLLVVGMLAGLVTHTIALARAEGHKEPNMTSRSLNLPTPVGAGKPKEVTVIAKEPALKVVSIVLRGGTVLPQHHSEVPVTIVALSGEGTVVTPGGKLPLDAAHAVLLSAKVPHAVEPKPGTDLVLLVHHVGQSQEHHHP